MPPTAPLWKLLSAFAALYLVWGSTYLAIRFAIETLPPFTMPGSASSVSGGEIRATKPAAIWGGAGRPRR